jgi:hypothetical protein
MNKIPNPSISNGHKNDVSMLEEGEEEEIKVESKTI